MSNSDNIIKTVEQIKSELKQSPEEPSLLNDLGVGYHLLGRYEEAAIALEKATKKRSKASYHFNLGNTYSELEKNSMAIDQYLQALNLDPNHAGALNNLADEYEAAGDIEKAHELFHYATRLNPDDPVAHFNLGNFLLRQNNHIEASKEYEKVLELDEKFIDAYHNIAWILIQAKAYDHAKKYIQKGLEISNDDSLKKLNSELKRVSDS